MGVKSDAKAKVAKAKAKAKKVKSQLKSGAKEMKSQLQTGAKALVGQEAAGDEESLLEKLEDKSEGEEGKVVKMGNGVPRVTMSESGRQAFWFIIIALSVLSCQAGLVVAYLGGTLRPALESHDVLMRHYGRLQATVNVGRAGGVIVVAGLMMVKGSAFQLIAALLARQKRKSRRRCAVKLAFGCVLFELVFIILVIAATIATAVTLRNFFIAFMHTFPQAIADGYLKSAAITEYVNWLQLSFQCCGNRDPKDWMLSDWMPLQWVLNRFPHMSFYRNKISRVETDPERYPGFFSKMNMSSWGQTAPSRVAYMRDRINYLSRGVYGLSNYNPTDVYADKIMNWTGFSSVPFSCCRFNSPSTYCVRDYALMPLFNYGATGDLSINRLGCAAVVRRDLKRRLRGVGIMLLVLIGVRSINLLLLRLAQTSTFNALVARRHLSPAFGWLFTTARPQSAPADPEQQRLLDDELLDDEWDGDDSIDSETLLALEAEYDTGAMTDGDASATSDGTTDASAASDGTTDASAASDATGDTDGSVTSDATGDTDGSATSDADTSATSDATGDTDGSATTDADTSATSDAGASVTSGDTDVTSDGDQITIDGTLTEGEGLPKPMT